MPKLAWAVLHLMYLSLPEDDPLAKRIYEMWKAELLEDVF